MTDPVSGSPAVTPEAENARLREALRKIAYGLEGEMGRYDTPRDNTWWGRIALEALAVAYPEPKGGQLMAYETTSVPVERSQGEIRKLLQGHGAGRFAFGEETDSAGVRWAAVSFTHAGYSVRMRVPHKPIDERLVRSKLTRTRTKTREEFEAEFAKQEAKRIWRVMHWNLKARLVAVDEGLETFAEAFLSHLVNPASGRTVFEELADAGTIDLGRPLALLGPRGEN